MNYSHLCTPCYAYNGNGAWQVDLLGVSPGWVLRIPLFFYAFTHLSCETVRYSIFYRVNCVSNCDVCFSSLVCLQVLKLHQTQKFYRMHGSLALTMKKYRAIVNATI